MGRTIVSSNDLGFEDFQAGGAPRARPTPAARRPMKADAYTDRLLKLIPGEIVALWVTLRGVLTAAGEVPPWLPWIALLALLALSPLYLRRLAKIEKWLQVWLTTLAVLVWAYSLGLPFDKLPAPYYMPIYPAILLPLFTFALPLWKAD